MNRRGFFKRSMLALAASLSANTVEPFKLGTFEIHGATTLGIVLRDQLIVDLHAANAAFEADPAHPKLPMPSDMLELIDRYEHGVKSRLFEIVNDLVASDRLSQGVRPSFVYDVDELRTLPPIMYPGKILNAAVNFYSHVNETGTEQERAAARRQRRDNRGVPYLFLKPSRGAVIGNGDPIVIPYGRDRTDWEVELGLTIGKPGQYIGEPDALDHVAGYCTVNDVSERAYQIERSGQWVKGKSADTFGPIGPWLVTPDEVPDPQNLRLWCEVDGERRQDGSTATMIFDVAFLISYLSHFMSLQTGDIVSTGTPPGVGMGQKPPRYLKAGNVVTLGIEGLGEQEHKCVQA